FVGKLPKGTTVIDISSVTHYHTKELVDLVAEKLKNIPKPLPLEIEQERLDERDTTSLFVRRFDDGSFEVYGGLIDKLIRGVVLSDPTSFAYFQKRLKEDGILDLLREHGAKEGDTIHIKDVDFEYID
ncbi:MAG: Obg family GTPase CgtA, partial [Christensenellales bacterium]